MPQCGWDIQDRMGIDRCAFVAHFEVQVRAGGSTTGHADQSNYIALADTLTAGYLHTAIKHMGVKGLPAIAMVNDDQVTIAPGIPAGIDNHACIGGIDRIA